MDDFIKLLLAGLGVYAVFRLTEPPPYVAPYYVPYWLPYISNRYLFSPGGWNGGFPWPRPPLGDGEGLEVGGSGHGGGHER